jgi:glutaredoxin
MAKLAGLNAQVLGISVDHVPCLIAWAESLGGINYPLLSDFWPHGAVAEKYGVLRSEGKSERALFIIDKHGIIRYIDIHDIDDQPANEELFAALRKIDPQAAALEPAEPEPVGLPKGGIVMYCTRWCSDCAQARKWLKKRGLEYVEVDINATPGAAKQVRAWADGKLVTPTFDIDGTVVVDFDIKKLTKILA